MPRRDDALAQIEPPPPRGTPTVEVRDVRGVDELRACQALQRRAWGITEDGYVVPVATMAAAQKVGGLVLGAFHAGRLVGFSFAFLGRLRGELILYSQLTGVDPELQGAHIGRRLKLEQWRRARAMDTRAVVWAFDPLQASNASFNLAVLGATCRGYEVDLYGSRSDALNAGLATDRLLAEWSTAPRPARAEPGQGAVWGPDAREWDGAFDLLETAAAASPGLRRPVRLGADGPPHAPRLRLEIPADLAATKAAQEGRLARQWQDAVRRAFQLAFERRYVAVGFARGERPCYLLERERSA